MAQIFFAHANGLPAGTYSKLFQHLGQHQISFHPAFGVGEYQVKTNWRPLVEELIDVLSQQYENPVVGLGHSLGAAVMMMTAQKRPELFSRLIVMDPPFLSFKYRVLIRVIRTFGPSLFKYIFPLSRGTLNRRQHFPDRSSATEYWEGKPFFSSFDPDCLKAYVNHGLIQGLEGGLTLTIPAKIEAQIFATIPSRLPKISPDVQVDYLYALGRGAVLGRKGLRELKMAYPTFKFHPQDGGHMFPLEDPVHTASFIKSLLDT